MQTENIQSAILPKGAREEEERLSRMSERELKEEEIRQLRRLNSR
jgi:hypothetical protein